MAGRVVMDALLFAAGLGTRLRPITDTVPKALIGIGPTPMIERVARRVVAAGADRIVVNVHRHALQIEGYVAERDGFGVEVLFSREPERPLETGGGLLHAAPLLRRDGPILLHNTDVLTTFPLAPMLAAHARADALATLAVNERRSRRVLRFDDAGLFGWRDRRSGEERTAREPRGATREYAFCGVHVVSPELLERITERGVFSIVESYLRLAGEGATIRPHPIGDAFWIDIGTPERLAEACRRLEEVDGPTD